MPFEIPPRAGGPTLEPSNPLSCSTIASSSFGNPFSSGDEVGNGRSVHEFHHQRQRIGRPFESMNLRDVRVIQRGKDFGFPSKPGQAIGVRSDVCREDLDRDVALQICIIGAIHLAHSTRADSCGDLVRTDARAGRQRHGCVSRAS